LVLYHLEIPLLSPFITAGGSVSTRSVGLVSASRSGHTGWGEAAPYPGQDETFGDVLDAARSGGLTPTLHAAIDEATSDLHARERGVALASELGPLNSSVPISVAVGMGDSALSTVEDATNSGIYRFKVKIMPGHTSHVTEIRRRVPRAVIGVDANGSFEASTMREILGLRDVGIAYVEQPTRYPWDGAVSALRDEAFDVFFDESVRSVRSAERVLECSEVSGVVVKPGRLGWRSSVEVVEMARAAGKLWRASGLLETGVGRSFTVSLAAATDAFVSDVAPAGRFFSHDIAPAGVLEGNIIVPQGPGTGICVEIDAVRGRAQDAISLSGSAVQDPG
jgi:O-succinylbenzoate synthase